MIVKVVSDTHFNHSKLIEWHRKEFVNVEDMNEAIIVKWNKEIKPHHKVIHLGDFAFGTDLAGIERICQRLNGNITLILGNHDTLRRVSKVYNRYFKCIGGLSWGDYYFTHEPVHPTVIDPKQLRSTGRQATINIHGHQHNGECLGDNYVNCCLDVVGLENMVMTLEIEKGG